MANEAPYAKVGQVALALDEDVDENRFLRTTTIGGKEHLLVSDPNAGGGGGGGGTEFDDGDSIDTDSQGTLIVATTAVPGTARALRCDDDGALHVADGGNSLTVDGTVSVDSLPSLPAGGNEIGDIGTVGAVTSITNDVNIADGGNVISVDDGAGSLTVDDGGSSLTVDGTVAVSAIAADVSIDDGGNVISVDDAGGSLTVDASQLDVDDLNASDDVVSVWSSAHSSFLTGTATSSGATQILAGASSQSIKVRSFSLHNAGSSGITVNLQDAAVGSFFTAYLAANGGGIQYTYQKYKELTTGTSGDLDINLSAGGSVNYNIEYFQD